MIGTTISHYEILKKLEQGGMGIVYKAKDTRLRRVVAIKFLAEELCKDREALTRFRREAYAASSLNHPNICTIHEIDEHQGRPFIVMEYLKGQTLRTRIKISPLETGELLAVGIQLVDALAAAHKEGILHRDIKPANVFIQEEGSVKLLDFGLAKLVPVQGGEPGTGAASTKEALLTSRGGTLGTVAYMSPEQALAKKLDERTDIFSVGAVLYELATGKRAFDGDSTAGVFDAVLNKTPLSPVEINPEIPPKLEAIIYKAIQKDPVQRFSAATELRRALDDLKQEVHSGNGARPGGRPVRKSTPRGHVWDTLRKPHVSLGALAAIVTLLLIANWMTNLRDEVAAPVQTPTSIAVMPFDDLSEDSSQAYFADGMAEELINALTHVEQLRVIARNSSFAMRDSGLDVGEIGQRLGVGAVLEGSVRRAEGSVRVSAQLVSVAGGHNLWSDIYERESDDIFDVQEEIALSIVGALKIELGGEADLSRRAGGTDSVAAYESYLHGRYEWDSKTPEGLQESLRYYNEAIAEDSNYALPYLGLADSYYDFVEYGLLPGSTVMPLAKAAALEALKIDAKLAAAHATLGLIHAAYDHDWVTAEDTLKKSLTLNPGSAQAHHWYGLFLAWIGRFEEGLEHIETAKNLDPLSLGINRARGTLLLYDRRPDEAISESQKMSVLEPNFFCWHLDQGEAYLQMERFDEAIDAMERGRTLTGDNPMMTGMLGYAYAVSGRAAEAQALFDELTPLSEQNFITSVSFLLITLGQGNADRAFEWLYRVYEERHSILVWLKVDYKVDWLRSDPRFDELVQKMNYPH